MQESLKIFKNWQYTLIATVISVVIFVLTTWLPNIRLLFSVWTNSSISFRDKFTLPLRLTESITTNFTRLSASYTVVIAVLVGINVAFIVYLIRKRKGLVAKGGLTAGAFGMITGVLGVGCAACGSLILSGIVGTAAGASILALLPLRGGEFGIIGVVFLGVTTYLLAKQINKPLLCDVN